QPNPNDWSFKDLSDTTCDPYICRARNADGTDIPSGDDASSREFSVDGSGNLTNLGGHNDSTLTNSQNSIQLFPYDDTTNNGGVYILAVCKIDGSQNTGRITVPTVNPSNCKYDAFKVMQGGGGGGTPTASGPTVLKDASGAYDTTFTWGASK